MGQKCIVCTDNNSLSHLGTAKLGAKEQRWVAELAVFDYTVRYCLGGMNQNADALSRQHPHQVDMTGVARPGTPVPQTVRGLRL